MKLTLITHRTDSNIPNYIDFILQCIRGGITAIQLREKEIRDDLADFALKLRDITRFYSISLIINDYYELCKEVDADGVHIGQCDAEVNKVRVFLGPEKIIGLTVNHISQIKIANKLNVNYIGVGSIFPTKSKPDIERIWGIEGLKKSISISKHPIVAVGGIDKKNIIEVINTHVFGIAAISLFHDSKNVLKTIKEILVCCRL